MADRKIAAVGSLLFCGLVVVLLLILYYPDTSITDDDLGDLWTPKNTVKSWNNFEYNTEAPKPESKFATAAKVIEDMGASFLALLAVISVAIGLTLLTCACCIA